MSFVPEDIEVYRGFRITTRISGNGFRIYYPNSGGLFDFTLLTDVAVARAMIDERIDHAS